MSNDLTSQNLINAFPYALSVDGDMKALASAIASELKSLYDDDDMLTIYTNISQLTEPLLDILANDYKVDWYLFDGTLSSKRAQIQSCFYVHRHLGTKGAIVYALSDLCPGTDVEEWFEYNGLPYYFRIILDVTEQRLPISQDVIERLVKILKPTRSVLEKNSIIYRSRNIFRISVNGDYAVYTTRLCGTHPKQAVQGETDSGGIHLTSDGSSADYSTRVCGWPLGSLI